MRRKLGSVLLSAFALLLLMGAGEETALLANKEESVTTGYSVSLDTVLRVEANLAQGEAAPEAEFDMGLVVNDRYAPMSVGRVQEDGVTYVSLSNMARLLDRNVQVQWDEAQGMVTITSEKLNLTARVGECYIQANGRYLYLPKTVQNINGSVVVPLWAVVDAFDATLAWNSITGVVNVMTGTGGIESGESYYDQDDLFWLSRVIYAESGNQPMDGKIAVGNVVMNRVKSVLFPDSILGVVSQKNQFSVYKNGALANRTPNESSIIAAKLVLEGAVLEQTEGALYFDSLRSSWASRSREHIATIGNHKFYR